jgi:ribonuclease P protein component
MVLLFLKSRLNTVKIGFSVSKKIGNSVTRNKVKRRLKEIVRELIPRIKNNYSYIIIAKPGIEDAEFQKIKENVIAIFEKSNKLVSI